MEENSSEFRFPSVSVALQRLVSGASNRETRSNMPWRVASSGVVSKSYDEKLQKPSFIVEPKFEAKFYRRTPVDIPKKRVKLQLYC